MRSSALDRFRTLAVFSMIQGHAFTALLAPDALGSPPPRWYTLIHGLTAPMFLCGAGLAFGFSRRRVLAREWRTPRERWASMVPGLKRAVWLFALGTALQLPGGSLHRAFNDVDAWRTTCAVGPLQLIALCLALAELLRVACAGVRAFRWGLAAWLGVVLVCSPAAWSRHWAHELPLALGTWLHGRHGSSFPALPWMAFFVFGLLLSCTSAVDGAHRARHVSALGVLMITGAYALHHTGGTTLDPEVYWHAGPLYVIFRGGACALVFGLLAFFEGSARGSTTAEFSPVRLFSRHSLVAYVVHLVALYGSPYSRGLVHRVHGASLVAVVCLTVGLLALSLVCCVCAAAIGAFTRAPDTRAPIANTRHS